MARSLLEIMSLPANTTQPQERALAADTPTRSAPMKKKRLTAIAAIMIAFYVAGIITAIHAVMTVRTPQGAIAWSVLVLTLGGSSDATVRTGAIVSRAATASRATAARSPRKSPRATHGSVAGPHTFEVRATDPAGNADQTPPTHARTIENDTTAGVSGYVFDGRVKNFKSGNAYIYGKHSTKNIESLTNEVGVERRFDDERPLQPVEHARHAAPREQLVDGGLAGGRRLGHGLGDAARG